ncbi:MAG: hypothetical protein AAF799_21470 [Myxococcota bacterium]
MIHRGHWFVLVFVVLCMAGFSTPALFGEPATAGGGGGRYFTGSARDGFGCDVCHEGSLGTGVEVTGLPEVWRPDATYTLELRWAAELGTASFVGEVVDDEGRGMGTMATPPPSEVLADERCASGTLAVRLQELPEDERAVFTMPACGATRARVQWTAPDFDEGSAWVHIGFVHGDDSSSPQGDRVQMISHELPSVATREAGCRVGTGSRSTVGMGLLAWLCLLGLGWPRTRRRR